MTVTIGVDVGTQGSKAGVYLDDGTCVGTGYAEHTFTYPAPGRVEMDPGQIEDAVLEALAAAVAQAAAAGVAPARVGAVAFSGILCGPVLVDASWTPVRPLIPFLDVRAQDEVAALRRDIAPQWEVPLWEAESGNATLDTYIPAVTLHWVRDHEPHVWARVAKVLSLAPYVAGRLAGLRADDAFTDPTHLSGWIIGWDAATGTFSERQLAALGLDPAITPAVVPSTHVVGGLTPRAAERTGLPAGTPLVAGAGDVPQSNLSAGLLRAGQAVDVAGTASILTVGVEGGVPALTKVPGMLYSLGTLPGQSFYWGYVKAGGLSLRWFRDQVLGRPGDDAVYAEHDALAAGVAPGSDGVLFLPYLSGGGPDSPLASGTWLGMTAATGAAQLWRSMLEAIAFEYAEFLREFDAAGVPVAEVLAVGGGARSPLWNAVKADVVGIPWRTPSRQDGAVLADAALARAALGLAPDLAATVADWVGAGEAAVPDAARTAAYAGIAATRRRLLTGPLRETFDLVAAVRSTEPEETS
jgi:xylulokinase